MEEYKFSSRKWYIRALNSLNQDLWCNRWNVNVPDMIDYCENYEKNEHLTLSDTKCWGMKNGVKYLAGYQDPHDITSHTHIKYYHGWDLVDGYDSCFPQYDLHGACNFLNWINMIAPAIYSSKEKHSKKK